MECVPITRQLAYLPNGSLKKVKIRMGNTQFADDMLQPLYFHDGHPSTGVFKGMKTILEDGFKDTDQNLAKCKDFKCPPGAHDCCCCFILHHKPDFEHVETVLETVCKKHSFQVKFLPKFHCNL